MRGHVTRRTSSTTMRASFPRAWSRSRAAPRRRLCWSRSGVAYRMVEATRDGRSASRTSAASAGASYYDYVAHMKRGEGGAWSVLKMETA